MKRRIKMAISLLVITITFSLTNLSAVPSRGFPSISKVRNSTPLQSGTVVESYSFEEDRERVRFDESTLTNSGNLAFASTIIPAKGTKLTLFENMKPMHIMMTGEYIHQLSNNGKFFFTLEENVVDKERNLYANKFNFYEGYFKRYSLDLSISPSPPNKHGECTAISRDYKDMYLYNKNGTRKEIQGIVDYAKLDVYSMSLRPFFSDNRLVACLASPLFEEDPDIFPKGSRLFYYDKNLRITDFVDFNGKSLSSKFGISNSKDYILMKSYKDYNDFNSYKIHIIHNQKEILTLDGNLSVYSFSEDESLVILMTMFEEGSGCYIIDLANHKVHTKISGLSSTFAIANKGYPVIAIEDDNVVSAYNYETNQLLMREWIGTENRRFNKLSRIQISGDGKQISVFEKQWFKKFEIGEVK